MSEFTGTPGPWAEWQKDGAPHTTRIVSTVDNTIVAELNEWRTPWVSQAADNARLIAAAPELLACLQETLRALEAHLDDACREKNLTHRDLLCPYWENEVSRARAIIEKATGETE